MTQGLVIGFGAYPVSMPFHGDLIVRLSKLTSNTAQDISRERCEVKTIEREVNPCNQFTLIRDFTTELRNTQIRNIRQAIIRVSEQWWVLHQRPLQCGVITHIRYLQIAITMRCHPRHVANLNRVRVFIIRRPAVFGHFWTDFAGIRTNGRKTCRQHPCY